MSGEHFLFTDRLSSYDVRTSPKFSVKHISAMAEGNDLKFGMQLYHDELYCVSYFQVCRVTTSCLPIDLVHILGGGICDPWSHSSFILFSIVLEWRYSSLGKLNLRQ